MDDHFAGITAALRTHFEAIKFNGGNPLGISFALCFIKSCDAALK